MSEKTLGDILDEVQDGGKPEYDDLRYALLAMSALRHFDSDAIFNMARKEKEGKYHADLFGLQYQVEQSFRRIHDALNVPPKHYVGPSHDPDTEECQKFRRFGKALLKKVAAQPDAGPVSQTSKEASRE